ncbi:MAG: diadenylate cyclase [Candidatus Gallimonas sp.]
MRTLSEIGRSIAEVFTRFSWIYAVEGVLAFLLIYYVLKLLYENNAKRLIPVYALLLVAVSVVGLFSDLPNAGTVYLFTILILSLFFLLLFAVEIKRGIWKSSSKSTASAAATERHAPKTQLVVHAEECISGIVKAVQNLSKNDVGALIVLSNGNVPKEILESGVSLNANISSQLIEGIFIPKAPLHDGAMVIYGDKIQAAGCFLPLTQKEYPKELGTRHRAGIGVTEVADVATIIVSEETGIVSVVKRGNITRYVDSDGLRSFLRDYYWKEFNAGGKRV